MNEQWTNSYLDKKRDFLIEKIKEIIDDAYVSKKSQGDIPEIILIVVGNVNNVDIAEYVEKIIETIGKRYKGERYKAITVKYIEDVKSIEKEQEIKNKKSVCVFFSLFAQISKDDVLMLRKCFDANSRFLILRESSAKNETMVELVRNFLVNCFSLRFDGVSYDVIQGYGSVHCAATADKFDVSQMSSLFATLPRISMIDIGDIIFNHLQSCYQVLRIPFFGGTQDERELNFTGKENLFKVMMVLFLVANDLFKEDDKNKNKYTILFDNQENEISQPFYILRGSDVDDKGDKERGLTISLNVADEINKIKKITEGINNCDIDNIITEAILDASKKKIKCEYKISDELSKKLKEINEICWDGFLKNIEINKVFYDKAWAFYKDRFSSPGDGKEIAFKFFVYNRAILLSEGEYIFFFPYWSRGYNTLMFSGLTIAKCCEKELRNRYELRFFQYFNIVENFIDHSYKKLLNQVANIKAAVGSIMSRNGSHNIGSHVLAALSHNVGTLPDDRVLYQYIQQRMDYIATVTTDFPTWTQPTMFVADMMKTFLSQRHLLDHIVESEGLHAFQFQNPNMTDEEWKAQENCVKIHIRRKKGKKYKELIDYTKRDAKVSLQDGTEECDISLAIPGGIIGEHAFYTILENIIRNAAKHSWATGNNNAKNLDIYIDFTDEDEQVKFKVYAKLEPSKCKKLVDELKKKLSQSFIDEDTGALRRENWGLAEMKISAGYLAGEPIEAIGGVGDKKGTNDIITPYVESSKYLGYEFFIAKPKEILIIVKNEDENKWNDEKGVMKKSGIFVKTIKEAKEELKLNYRYIVHYDATEFFDIETREPKDGILIPFRMLSGKSIPENDWSWLQPFVADLDDGVEASKSGFNELQVAFKNGDAESVRKIVYKAYYEHLKKTRNGFWRRSEGKKKNTDKNKGDWRNKEIKDVGLLVAINENEKAGGNSLISDADILELMMEENFAVCVDQYEAMYQGDAVRDVIKLLGLIKNSSNDERKVQKFKGIQGRSIRELIAQRLYDWITNRSDDYVGVCAYLQNKYFASGKNGPKKTQGKSKREEACSFEECVNAMIQSHPIDQFIRYAESVFENTKKLFKQYEEQIVTLPAGYKVQATNVGEGEQTLMGIKIEASVKEEKLKKEKDCHWIGYRRHSHTLPVDATKRLYVEPLSGTQTYLSQLSKVKNDLGLQMRLVENGLMRILVLDERVAKFLREHMAEVGDHYKAMNINVIDDKWVEAGDPDVAKASGFFTGYTKDVSAKLENYANATPEQRSKVEEELGNIKRDHFNDIDILIVHQGILDKWFEKLKSVEGMKRLLEGFKQLVKYVVVTTGRGTPENIPEEAHLLPFAVVESTLFKKYPEKLILTDTIMNVLPVGKKNNGGGQE